MLSQEPTYFFFGADSHLHCKEVHQFFLFVQGHLRPLLKYDFPATRHHRLESFIASCPLIEYVGNTSIGGG